MSQAMEQQYFLLQGKQGIINEPKINQTYINRKYRKSEIFHLIG
jgi:hypothetical protein